MDWEALVALVVPSLFIVTVGGVVILRPIASKLGTLLEVMAREKAGSALEETRRLREAVEAMNDRLSLLEERQDFTERLIGPRASGRAAPAAGGRDRPATGR